MSSQLSSIPVGTDATKLAGYALSTSRLGNLDLIIANTGDNTLSMKIGQFTSGNPSSYTTIVPMFTVVPGGQVSKSLSGISSQTLGFFGSGNTTAQITPTFRNPSDLRGAQIDIFTPGKLGWSYDVAYDTNANQPTWPVLPSDGPRAL